MKTKTYAIATTHFDPVWLWTYDEALSSIRATLYSALDRMNEYPNFIYSFSCPPVFEFIKKTDKKLFKQILKRVKQGRWELNEGWWVQPDCSCISGESLVRQGLYGQNFLKKNFKVTATTAFNTDSFGHNAQLPQILKKSGIQNYMFMRPASDDIEFAPLFMWEGLDGTKISAYRFFNDYTHDINSTLEKAKEYTTFDPAIIYGVTDHGGAPTKKAIEAISGKTVFSRIDSYFLSQQEKQLTTIKGELPVKYFGVYINLPQVKGLNRVSEKQLINAEVSIVLASALNGKSYGQKDMHKLWKGVLFNQFHDIVGGASIKDAYFDAQNLYGKVLANASEIININLQSIAKKVNCKSNLWNIVAFNLNGTDFSAVVESEVQWVWEFDWYSKGIALEDENGEIVECQVIKEKSAITGFRSRFAFFAKIPAFSFKVYKVVQTQKAVNLQPLQIDRFENQSFLLSVGKNGKIDLLNKKSGQLLKDILRPIVKEDGADTWCFDAPYGYTKNFEECEFINLKVLESGTIKTRFKLSYLYRKSEIDIYLTMGSKSPYIDIAISAYWKEKNKVLKLKMPCADDIIQAGIPFGKIKRSKDNREMPFTDTINTLNYTVITDSVFCYSLDSDNTINLSLLRSAKYGHLNISALDSSLPDLTKESERYAEYDYLSMGENNFSLRLLFENESEQEHKKSFLNPPKIVVESQHQTKLTSFKPFEFISKNCEIVALKNSEKKGSRVVRIVNLKDKESQFIFKDTIKKIVIQETLKPFEIATYKLTNKGYKQVNLLEK